jgi:hypothetical protein
MFKKSRKDALVDQAQSLASDISGAIAPHVERARDEVGPRLADARDALAPKISDARDAIAPKLSDARDAISPRLSDARDAISPRLSDAKDALAPRLADARDQATPYVESARDTFVKDVVPAVRGAVAEAREQAGPLADEAKRRGSLAAAALKGEDVKRKGGKKKYFLFAGLLAAGAVAFKKLRGGDESANWQSSYTPSPAPAAPTTPSTPATPSAGAHVADTPADSPADSPADTAGANPSETLADAAEKPHGVTTPDAPAEEVVVDEDAGDEPEKKA